MQGTYTPKQPRKIPDGLIWSLFIIMIVLLVLATIGFTLYFVNDNRSGQAMPTPAFVVEPPVQETATLQPEETVTETAVPEEPTLIPVDAVTEIPTVVETAGPYLPSPTFVAEATATPTTIPAQPPILVPTATALSFWWDAGDQFPQWQAEYFANAMLSGVPALTRNDMEINFDWGRNNPVPGTTTDNFSVRWRRSLSFEEGNYRFHALIDDGARVYVDGSLVLDNWQDGSLREVTADRFLSAGIHQIQVDYYERSGDARARFWWEKISQVTYPDWKGEYWANRQLSGDPTLSRNDANINFDWKGNAPANGMPSDNFSVRWTRTHSFNDGRYRFHAFVDDGVRLYVDNSLIIDQWADGKPRELTADINLSNGNHTLRVEYFERLGDAQIRIWWEKLGPISYPDWKGEYWNNRNLQGNPAFTRNDNDINFDWKFNAPHSSLPSDNFSARWSRQLNLEAGIYRFFAKADDGVRVYVDGQPVINEWHDSGGNTTYKADVTLTAGIHAVVVEYYEREFGAEVKVWRERLSGLPTATATATLPPTTVPPTATPTLAPTATPTVIPTATPTDIPTATPTELPPTVTPMPSTTIGLRPATGSANDLVTIIGEGYPSKTALFIHIGRPDEAPLPQPIASTQSDQGGKVNVSFRMPAAWPNGGMINRDVILVHLATADFQESASARFNYVAADQPALTLSPAQGTLGSVVVITGSGFPATSGIDLYLSTPDNSGDETSYGQATTSQKGNFVIQFTLPLTWADGKPITGNTLRIAASGENNIQAAVDFLLLNGTIE